MMRLCRGRGRGGGICNLDRLGCSSIASGSSLGVKPPILRGYRRSTIPEGVPSPSKLDGTGGWI